MSRSRGSPADLAVLLATWDALVRADVVAPARLYREARRNKSVLRPGAEPSTVEATEARLGLRLPPSYREFLLLSDGAYADASGAVTESTAALPVTYTSGPGFGFLRTADVTWLSREIAPGIYDHLEEAGEPVDSASPADKATRGPVGRLVEDLSPVRSGRVLVISSVWESHFNALVPRDGPEWEFWTVTRDEIVGYPSFRSWLEHATETPESDRVMDLIRWRRSLDPRGEQLEKVRDPAALPILLAALDEFADEEWVVIGVLAALSRIRSNAAVPAIEPWVRRSGIRNFAVGALMRTRTPDAIDALARQGAHRELWEIGDPRSGDVAARELRAGDLTAAGTLGNLGDAQYVPVLREAWQQRKPPLGCLAIAAALYRCGAAEATAYLQDIAQDETFPEWQRQRASEILAGTEPT